MKAVLFLVLLCVAGAIARADGGAPILLRSSWQTANIGDIDHTPGLLALLQKYAPDRTVILWPVNIQGGVEPMLRKAFPKLRIVQGRIGADGRPDTAALQEAFRTAGFLLHGSGPDVVAARNLAAWSRITGKPYGIYGVTVDRTSESYRLRDRPMGVLEPEMREVLDHARFVYCRETTSLAFLKKEKISAPTLAFAPDAVFGVNLSDPAGASAWRESVGLTADGYLCVIPRTRFAPYYKIEGKEPNPRDLRKENYNALHTEGDMAKLREAICLWVRKTGRKVALCPEMSFEMEVGQKEIFERLPADVKPFVVVHRAYWLPDEAASVYARASLLLSMECHSPIIAATVGTPSLYLHTPTETSKGQMWRDIGLGDSILELDDVSGADIGAAILKIEQDPAAVRATLAKALAFVQQRQAETMAVVARVSEGK